MMAKTHAAFGVALTSFALSTADVPTLCIAAAATQLPDVDSTKSFAGRVFYPVAWLIESRFAHRTLTHSVLATFFVALVAYPLSYGHSHWWHAVTIGYFSGWFGDVFTKTGAAAFYPLTTARLVVPPNPRLRLETGSRGELVVFALFLLSIGGAFWLYSAGGMMRTVNQFIAAPVGASALFEKESARREIIAHIEGYNFADNSPVNDDFQIIEAHDMEMLVSDRNGVLFKAGESPDDNIRIRRITATLGRQVTITSREIKLDDEDMAAIIKKLNTDENSRVFLTGTLIVKSGAQGLTIAQSVRHFNTMTLSANETDAKAKTKTVTLKEASLEDLRKLIDTDVSGTLFVKEVKYGSFQL